MAKKEIVAYSQQMFENIKHVDENGNEFWFARELQKALEYTEYACDRKGYRSMSENWL